MPKEKVRPPSQTTPSVPAQAKLQRVRDYGTVLATVIKDDRLSGNRRLLAVLLGKYFSIGSKNGKAVSMSEQESKDKEMLYNVIVEQFGNHKNIQWLDSEDRGPSEAATTRIELDATEKIRNVFSEI